MHMLSIYQDPTLEFRWVKFSPAVVREAYVGTLWKESEH